MNNLERLAIMQGIANAIKPHISRGKGGLRDEVDAEILQQYEADHVDRKRVIINGVDVGTLSVEAPAQTKPRKVVFLTDRDAFADWVRQNADLIASYLINDNPAAAVDLAGDILITHGELAAGCEFVVEVQAVADPKTVLRIKQDKLAEAIGGELPAYMMGVLTDGS